MALSLPFLIIKTGSTLPELRAQQGDFEQWVLRNAGVDATAARIINVQAGESLPAPSEVCAAIITGSHDMVTQRAAWSEITALWLREAVETGLPVLGICYGHQLLAHAFGGSVGDNPRGREFGLAAIQLTPPAQTDPLLRGFPTPLAAYVCHSQSVTRLPDGAQLLAASARDPHQIFRIGARAWGVQFHPEFNAEAARGYITAFADALRAEGQDPIALEAAIRDTPHGAALLQRFVRLITDEAGQP